MKKEEVNNDAILMIRKVLLVLIVLWMITVFAFSSQNGEGSGTLSHKIALLIFNNETVAERMDFYVRKGAHLAEFAYGSALIYGYCLTYPNMENKKRILFAIGCTVLYAGTDELHQLFVSGRGASIYDVIIDAVGAGIGTGLIIFATNLAKGTEYQIRHPEENDKVEEMFEKAGKRNKNTIFGSTAEVSINDLKKKVEKGSKIE